jgi:hypothetical protein
MRAAFLAALAPSLPRAVRTRFGKCATVRFFRAAVAALRVFLCAAFLCFAEVILGCRSYRFRLRVRAAFFAAPDRLAFVRFRAAERAWRESARCDAERRDSRLSAPLTARERLRRDFPFRKLRAACFFVLAEPLFGGGNFTPARRALDNPIAMACCGDRAPCFPSRMCSISSRTNSPACVDGDFPSRSSSRARSIVSCSGIANWFRCQRLPWS